MRLASLEREMTDKEKAKEERLKDKYDDSDMKDSMKDQYGADWENVYYATIRKQAMENIQEQPVDEGKMSPKEELKMLKANVKNPGQSDKAKEKMKARIKELEAMLEEGDYPSKLAKGHKNYKAQQAAVAISKRESKINKVSINQVCEAVKQNDPTIAVAQYVLSLIHI